MQEFFKKFIRKNLRSVFFWSGIRILAIIQALFWPYGLSRVVNALSGVETRWDLAVFWALLMIGNSLVENFLRLRSKYNLENVSVKLSVDLARFFSKKTKIRPGVRTGEAVQAVKLASEKIQSVANFFKENGLQMPIDGIIIPLVLLNAKIQYFLILLFYVFFYVLADLAVLFFYRRKFNKLISASQAFWGTEYRRVPDLWRKRENADLVEREVDEAGESLYRQSVQAGNVMNWLWISVQTVSTLGKGLAILYVLRLILHSLVPLGDLVLVAGYFDRMHGTLNIFTHASVELATSVIVLRRLNQAVETRK